MDDSDLDIGSRLKERREQLGYSMQDVSERIRIRKVYLESMESNNFSALPGRAYVTGFLDVYCRFLGLDSKEILASLAPEEDPKTSNIGPTPLAQKVERQFRPVSSGTGRSKLFWAGLVILLLGFASFLVPDFFVNQEPKESKPQVTAPAKPQAVDKATQNVVPEAPAKPIAENESTGKGSVPVENEIPAADKATSEPLPAISPEGSSLRMLALDDGSLIINIDKRQPFQYKLHDGLDLTWKIKDEVTVRMDQAGVARFWLDGQELDISGQAEFFMQSAPEG